MLGIQDNSGLAKDGQRRLFPLPEGELMSDTITATENASTAAESDDAGAGTPRLRVAERDQVAFRACCWNDLLSNDHEARTVWEYVQSLDRTPLLAAIKAVEGRPGHPPIDPRILIALWLYATLRGIGSARELARRCETDLPFQWICGGVSVNYHTLSDFRVAHVELLDDWLSTSIAVLEEQKLVTMDRVAQDGLKVRASAGAASFRRGTTLETRLAEAREQVEILKAELKTDPAAANRRQRAARERAARERVERLQKALEQLPLVQASKPNAEKREKARVSTTDPEARVMKMGDGGFRPAFNVQLAADTQTQLVTGVDVTSSGGDQGKLAPMIEQHVERYDEAPDEMLVDGGFVKKDDITAVSAPRGNTTVYAPVQASKSDTRDPHTPRPDDSPAVAEWRRRMATPEAKEIYKQRASTIECVNAQVRNQGLYGVRVRGRPKVLAVVLWYVLAHNLRREVALRAEAAAQRE
jgi:transposase